MKKYISLLMIALFVVAGIFIFFFYRMGSNDAKALADFPVDYGNYDQAITDLYNAIMVDNTENVSRIDTLEQKADQTLNALNNQASVRISSLTKNDGDLMKVSLEIAALAGNELDTLKAYRSSTANRTDDKDKLGKDITDLRNQRQAAYSHYLVLALGNN